MSSKPANMELVKSFLALFNSLPEADRRAILEQLPMPNEKKTPSLIGLARAGASNLSRAQVIDYAKRLEFCYRNWRGHNGKSIFIPYDKTDSLCTSIAEQHGESILAQYVKHIEEVCEKGTWAGFSRPERIQQHFDGWLAVVTKDKITEPI